MRDIAQTIGDGLGLPARGLTPEEAEEHFGWMAKFAAMDAPASSALTRARFPSWLPQEAGLPADLRENGYLA